MITVGSPTIGIAPQIQLSDVLIAGLLPISTEELPMINGLAVG